MLLNPIMKMAWFGVLTTLMFSGLSGADPFEPLPQFGSATSPKPMNIHLTGEMIVPITGTSTSAGTAPPAPLAPPIPTVPGATAANDVVDPYTAWMQGRPQEAIPALLARADSDDRWSSWYDCGLAAGAAGDDRGAAWLLAAHHRAPLRAEPLAALRALDADIVIAPEWSERLGPATLPATGWILVAVLAIGGLGLGWAVAGTRRRGLGVTVAVVAAVVVAPGMVAAWHDGHDGLVAALRDTSLVDSVGTPQAPISGGTVLTREDAAPLGDRILVHDANGHRGWIPQVDVSGSWPDGRAAY